MTLREQRDFLNSLKDNDPRLDDTVFVAYEGEYLPVDFIEYEDEIISNRLFLVNYEYRPSQEMSL